MHSGRIAECVDTYVHTYTHTMYMHTRARTCASVHTHARVYTRMHVCVHTCTCSLVHAYVYTQVPMHTHTCTRIEWQIEKGGGGEAKIDTKRKDGEVERKQERGVEGFSLACFEKNAGA